MYGIKLKFIFILFLVIKTYSIALRAQPFWQQTGVFPGGPKTGIVLVGDSCLFVSAADGIFRSCDEGEHFQAVLTTPGCQTIFASSFGRILAAGNGKIFFSDDDGMQWDSVSFPTDFSITQFAEDVSGNLYAITGQLLIPEGFVGAGVFFSADRGSTWEARNNGLGGHLGCSRIISDASGMLYLGITDESIQGGGLYISDNQAMQWQHVDIRIDGRGEISDLLNVGEVTGLSISREDSLYLSFTGIASNGLIQLNLSRKIGEDLLVTPWYVHKISDHVSWWLDVTLNNVFFSETGLRLSSVSGIPTIGGSFVKGDGEDWLRIEGEIGRGVDGYYHPQIFVENDQGKIFMIQKDDEQIYYHEETTTGIDDSPNYSFLLSIHPNPIQVGAQIKLNLTDPGGNVEAAIFDLKGNQLSRVQGRIGEISLSAPSIPGIYLIKAYDRQNHYIGRMIVF